jgi:His-Xaa-Ser system radical SAM maturase HxsB
MKDLIRGQNKINLKRIGFLRFKKIGDDYLITNDVGLFHYLSPSNFKKFVQGRLSIRSKLYKLLVGKGFIESKKSLKKRVSLFQVKTKNLLSRGPSLHIMAVTLRCNLRCVYCQASSRPLTEKKYDMSRAIAKKTVDFIFNTPCPNPTIEFQGGEPLVNWPVVKFIVEYSRKKAKEKNKMLTISIVSNLISMDEKKLEFLIKNGVHICTSLDGPREIHNKNRPYAQGDSYKITTSWIRKMQKIYADLEKKTKGRDKRTVGALATISTLSINNLKKIIDEYLKFGFYSIHLRPITYLGFGQAYQGERGYSAEKFIEKWKKALDYIISLNKKGINFYEREAWLMLQKILTDTFTGYTDLESPCGAVLGQILYNHDGQIYTCDEGRMLENDIFKLGEINRANYREIVLSKKTKTMLASSCLENTTCDLCVFRPYCGICPVRNYVYYGSLFPQIKNTDWCKIKIAQFDYLFTKMKDPEIKRIFEKWVGLRTNKVKR